MDEYHNYKTMINNLKKSHFNLSDLYLYCMENTPIDLIEIFSKDENIINKMYFKEMVEYCEKQYFINNVYVPDYDCIDYCSKFIEDIFKKTIYHKTFIFDLIELYLQASNASNDTDKVFEECIYELNGILTKFKIIRLYCKEIGIDIVADTTKITYLIGMQVIKLLNLLNDVYKLY